MRAYLLGLSPAAAARQLGSQRNGARREAPRTQKSEENSTRSSEVSFTRVFERNNLLCRFSWSLDRSEALWAESRRYPTWSQGYLRVGGPSGAASGPMT